MIESGYISDSRGTLPTPNGLYQSFRGALQPSLLLLFRWAALHIPAEVFVRSDSLEIDEAHVVLVRISQQIELAQTAKLEHLQLCKVALLLLANVGVLGDFNDTPDSRPIKALVGKGKTSLADTRPTERNGDSYTASESRQDPRRVAWTHFYAKEDTYSRVDYILLSRGLAAEWQRAGTRILTLPNWGQASDHRPIVAEFLAQER